MFREFETWFARLLACVCIRVRSSSFAVLVMDTEMHLFIQREVEESAAEMEPLQTSNSAASGIAGVSSPGLTIAANQESSGSGFGSGSGSGSGSIPSIVAPSQGSGSLFLNAASSSIHPFEQHLRHLKCSVQRVLSVCFHRFCACVTSGEFQNIEIILTLTSL